MPSPEWWEGVADVLAAKARLMSAGLDDPAEVADAAARTAVADVSLLLEGTLTLEDFRA
jgi:hypothetical protein